MYYIFIEFMILLHTFIVISLARCKDYMIRLISFTKFSHVLADFTCARAIGILWIIYLGDNILWLEWWEERPCLKNLYFQFWLEIFAFKIIKYFFYSLKKCIQVFKNNFLLLFFTWILWSWFLFLKSIISTNKLLWSSSASFKVILPL